MTHGACGDMTWPNLDSCQCGRRWHGMPCGVSWRFGNPHGPSRRRCRFFTCQLGALILGPASDGVSEERAADDGAQDRFRVSLMEAFSRTRPNGRARLLVSALDTGITVAAFPASPHCLGDGRNWQRPSWNAEQEKSRPNRAGNENEVVFRRALSRDPV